MTGNHRYSSSFIPGSAARNRRAVGRSRARGPISASLDICHGERSVSLPYGGVGSEHPEVVDTSHS